MISLALGVGAWLALNGPTIVEVALALHLLAVFVVNLTETPKDDAAVAKFYKAIEAVAGLVTRKAKR